MTGSLHTGNPGGRWDFLKMAMVFSVDDIGYINTYSHSSHDNCHVLPGLQA